MTAGFCFLSEPGDVAPVLSELGDVEWMSGDRRHSDLIWLSYSFSFNTLHLSQVGDWSPFYDSGQS